MGDISTLDVRLHGNTIGTIILLPGDRSIFAFTEDYINEQNRPTLSLSFKDEFGNLLTDHPSTGPNLLPYFSNLLPEGTLRHYLAEQAGVKQVRELYLLWALGRDLPGAVTVAPHNGDEWPTADGEAPEQVRERREKAFRFSLAGVQLKFSALKNEGKNGGLAIPAKGVGGS
jgi:serine/threonine-protein kinase HipA